MNKYRQIMDRVEVTEDMRSRVLNGIEEKTKGNNRFRVERYWALAACLTIIIAGSVVYLRNQRSQVNPDTQPEPYDLASSIELTEKSGIIIKDVETIAERSDKTTYKVYPSNLVEIVYDLKGESVRFRKAEGEASLFEDAVEYPEEESVLFNSTEATIKGKEGLFYLAEWTDKNYSYAMEFLSGKSKDEIVSLISGIMKPSAADLEAINSGIEYPREDEYKDSYEYAIVKAPHGHSVYGFGSADHLGSSYTVLDGEKVLVLADRKGYSCVIVLSQNKGRWINSNYLFSEEDTEEGTL